MKNKLFIKIIVLAIIFYIVDFHANAQDTIIKKNKIILKFDIKEMIGPAIWRKTIQAFNKANEINADLILIHMNTYGGLVDAADSIRTKILNSDIPVYVFIDNNAASAGALIAISCDSIYMRPGANIGAATVVNQTGEVVPDKYQSYMRSTMRATAEAHGKDTIINGKDTTYKWFRDPKIAEAMVDPKKYIENVIDSGEVLTFTANEAIKYNYCEGIAENIDELIKLAGIHEYTITQYEPSNLEKIIGVLVSPYLQGILIMIIIGGIYFELQTPGVGFPLMASILAAVLYFAPLYLEGIAEHWEILIFFIGIVLLLIEIFVIPGFGVAGVSGILLAITGLALSMSESVIFEVDGEFAINIEPFFRSLFVVLLSVFLSIGLSVALSQRIVKSKLFSAIALNKTQQITDGYLSVTQSLGNLVGKQGITYTILRPAGKVEIDGQIFDAKSLTGYIDKDEKIEVVKFEVAQLYVKKI
ncbi:MAG: nodulation protein NfeD [Bacteroidales bacterium]|nr:nodulation protein NfeD [Bacteroidales bacterium]MBN2758751.1 nodulation protein NfeD [Bacteroidales bacterium]